MAEIQDGVNNDSTHIRPRRVLARVRYLGKQGDVGDTTAAWLSLSITSGG